VALAVDPSLACPVFPEAAAPSVLPDWAEPLPAPDFCPVPHWLPAPLEPAWAGPLFGLDVAEPLLPEPLSEVVPALAGPVDPVLPDWVLPVVLALPDLAVDPEFDVVLTDPDQPPLPESPETAMGLEVALPVSVDPVEPVDPDTAF
jgi:hypothetical protein